MLTSPPRPLLQQLVPYRVRRVFQNHRRRVVFRRALRKLAGLAPRAAADPSLLSELVYGWGNESWVAQPAYLRAILEHAGSTSGPILECGSGLTTLLLGLAAAKSGRTVWSLEHNPAWHAHVAAALAAHRITNVELCLAPLRDHGGFAWYDAPEDRLPTGFGLVVCDGPPGSTRGGRYGLMMVKRLLAPGCVVLLDDAARDGERHVLRRWEEEAGWRSALSGHEKPYAIVTAA